MAKTKKIDILKLSRKASREVEIQAGFNLVSYRRVHANKKAYDRKENKRFHLEYA